MKKCLLSILLATVFLCACAQQTDIMEPSFTSMGVGCWFCSTAEGQYTYWTVTFQ